MRRDSLPGTGRGSGFLALYALRLMEERPIYVHEVVTRIAERTQGAWRPSPGAVYPSVRVLVDRGLARTSRAGGRMRYAITAAGRLRLRRARSSSGGWRTRFAHAWRLWLDFVPSDRLADFLLERVRNDLAVVREAMDGERGPLTAAVARYLHRQLELEFQRATEHFRQAPSIGAARPSEGAPRPSRRYPPKV